MKMKFNSDDDLPLRKTLEFSGIVIVLDLLPIMTTINIHKFP